MVLVTNTINVNTGDKISEIRQGLRVFSRVGCRKGCTDEYLRSLNGGKKKKKSLSRAKLSYDRDLNSIPSSATPLL